MLPSHPAVGQRASTRSAALRRPPPPPLPCPRLQAPPARNAPLVPGQSSTGSSATTSNATPAARTPPSASPANRATSRGCARIVIASIETARTAAAANSSTAILPRGPPRDPDDSRPLVPPPLRRSEEHTSEL